MSKLSGLLSLFKSRKFILTLIPVITLTLNELGYTAVSNETLFALVASFGALVASIAYEDGNKFPSFHEIEVEKEDK